MYRITNEYTIFQNKIKSNLDNLEKIEDILENTDGCNSYYSFGESCISVLRYETISRVISQIKFGCF